ncbi:MAG TPA: hypothetical protein VGB07_22460 [Blastocatellia bacterium]
MSFTRTTTRRTSGLPFSISSSDPLTVVPADSLLLRVAALAGYLSARQAARIDSMVVSRRD